MTTLIIASTLAAIMTLGGQKAPAGQVVFSKVDSGPQSGVEKKGVKTFRTKEAAVEALGQDKISTAPYQKIDWKREQLVVIYGGQQPTGGYSVEVKRIQRTALQIMTIEAVLNKPAPDMMVTQAITTPYAVIRMPKVIASIRVEWVQK